MPNRSMVIAQSAKVEDVANLLINIRIYIMHIQLNYSTTYARIMRLGRSEYIPD